MLWLVSDLHLGHSKILSMGTGRPFATIEEMNGTIIQNINQRVNADDTLYFLGDWCCGIGPDKLSYIRETRKRIQCATIHMIRGNHDPSVKRLQELVDDRTLTSVSEMLTVRIPGSKRDMQLCHYPLEDFEFEGAGNWQIHGHRHSPPATRKTKNRQRLDIGVDGHDYKPWSLAEIRAEMRSEPWEEKGHHG